MIKHRFVQWVYNETESSVAVLMLLSAGHLRQVHFCSKSSYHSTTGDLKKVRETSTVTVLFKKTSEKDGQFLLD